MSFFGLATRISEFGDVPSEGSQPKNRRSEPRLPSHEEARCIWIDREGRHQPQSIEILNRSDGGLGFRASQGLEPARTVRVDTGSGLKGVVRFCEPDGYRYRVGLIRVHRERRRVDREPMSGPLTLFWFERPGCWIASPSLIRNMTGDGMQVEVPMAVPVSSVVRLQGEVECEGITRYCEPNDGLYLIGVEFLGRARDKNALAYKE